jgi:hydroxyacylglutathione hydrolase
MKSVNSQGPPLLHGLPGEALEEDSFSERRSLGATIIDLRDPESFGRAHVPGSICIGAGPHLSTWASWVIPYDRPVLLIDEDPTGRNIDDATRSLIRVGLDQVAGHLKGSWEAWSHSQRPTETLRQLDPVELHQKLQQKLDILVLDVRSDDEWMTGHIAQAMHLMGGYLPEKLDEIPTDRAMIAVICGGGFRSTVAASLLQREGLSGVVNVSGGMRAWLQAELPITT